MLLLFITAKIKYPLDFSIKLKGCQGRKASYWQYLLQFYFVQTITHRINTDLILNSYMITIYTYTDMKYAVTMLISIILSEKTYFLIENGLTRQGDGPVSVLLRLKLKLFAARHRTVPLSRCGKIKIKLREIMEGKELSRYQLSKMTSTRFEVINKWYNGEVERIDSDVLARFCFVLNCRVEDLIEYEA